MNKRNGKRKKRKNKRRMCQVKMSKRHRYQLKELSMAKAEQFGEMNKLVFITQSIK